MHRWSVIASKLPGRTDNDVKNYWNTKLKKRYLASTKEAGKPPSSPPAAPPSGDDSAAAAGSDHQAQQDEPLLPLTPPALTDLDTAFADSGAAVVDDDMLLFKSEQLYAELVGLVEKQSQTGPSTGGDEASTAATTPSSSSSGTTSSCPTVSSSGSCTLWPMDVHDTTLLSESTTGLFDAYGVGDAFGAAALPAYSFVQDLLASSYDDVTAAVAQDLLYYQ